MHGFAGTFESVLYKVSTLLWMQLMIGRQHYSHLPLISPLQYYSAGRDDLDSPTLALPRHVQLVPPLHTPSISSPAPSWGRCDR